MPPKSLEKRIHDEIQALEERLNRKYITRVETTIAEAIDRSVKASEERFQKQLGTLNDSLKPVLETFRTASLLGKWTTATLVFISVLIGVILGLKKLIFHE